MITYQVQVLNAEKQLIYDQEVKGYKNALATARELPGAINFCLTHSGSPYGPVAHCEHKFDDTGWQGITRNRFQQVMREGIVDKAFRESGLKDLRNAHHYPGSPYQAYMDTFPTWPGHAEKASVIENPPDWSKPETGE